MRKIIATLAILLALALPASGQVVNGQGAVAVNGVLNAVMATSGTFAGVTITSADSSGLTDLKINPTVKTSGNLIEALTGTASRFSVTYGGIVTGTRMYAASMRLMETSLHSLATGEILWSETTSPGGTKDTGIKRSAAATVQITDGTTGTGNFTAKAITASSDSGAVTAPEYYGNKTAVGAAGTAQRIGWQTFNNSSGVKNIVEIAPVYNQTGTAGATDLLINRTETAVGSGAQNLIDAQVGTVSKFSVSNAGAVTAAGNYYVANGKYYETNTGGLGITGSSVLFGSSGVANWMSGASYVGTADLGLARSAAGTLKVTNGSTGDGNLHAGGLAIASAGSFTCDNGNFTISAGENTNYGVVSSVLGQQVRTNGLGSSMTAAHATQEITIADAAYTDSTIDLPANSIIHAVVGRVTVAIPTASTFSVGDPSAGGRFANGISVAANTTFVALDHHAPDLDPPGIVQATAAKVRITPDATPAAATGKVRIVIYYTQFVPPTS